LNHFTAMLKKYRNIISAILFLVSLDSFSQTVNYSPEYFGPNALPVPEFTDATIAEFTTLSVSWNYYSGFGDRTLNPYLKVEIPLIRKKVSFKIWGTAAERYFTSTEIIDKRASTVEDLSGTANGDVYVQTRIQLMQEKRLAPSIILNSTLKTASGNSFGARRYFDTPGYYFDLEIGKTFTVETDYIKKIRLVADAGFLCWETTNSTQNDALLYGLKLSVGNKNIELENSISGYNGWMNNGDHPLLYSFQLSQKNKEINFFGQYQYGIRDYPYHHIRLGINITLKALTPVYK
jgi:hypothetical protein